jgi:excisionase family DNA binding protein
MTDTEIIEMARELPPASLPAYLGTLAHASALATARLHTPPPQPARMVDRLLNVGEAAAMLGCSKTTLYHGLNGLTAKHIGRRVMFSEAEIQRYISKRG